LVIGSPLGLLIYLQIDISLLKLFAGTVVLFTLFLVLFRRRLSSFIQGDVAGSFEPNSIGVIAEIMGGSLAMDRALSEKGENGRRVFVGQCSNDLQRNAGISPGPGDALVRSYSD